MRYRFQVEDIVAAKGKLPRDERSDLIRYFSETSVEAEDGLKAGRALARKAAGRLSRDSSPEQLVLTLPDYGNCQLIVRVYAED